MLKKQDHAELLALLSSPKGRAELARCQQDFWHFAQYLKILTKDRRLVPLLDVIKEPQRDLINLFLSRRQVKILKARQIGCSTIISALLFWDTYLNPGHNTAVIAQEEEPAANLLDMYRRYYEQLPAFLQFPLEVDRTYKIGWANGGDGSYVHAWTATSKGFNSFSYTNIHASEMALWKDMDRTVSDLFQCYTGHGWLLPETTAKGLNAYHSFWIQDNGFEARFISWLDDPTYVRHEAPNGGPLNDDELAYIKRHKLGTRRANWYVQTLRIKCRGLQSIFDEMYPATAEMAFVTAGDRFFREVHFSDVKYHMGRMNFRPPGKTMTVNEREKFRVYTLGGDTAKGAGKDGSAYAVLDVTEWKIGKVFPVESFFDNKVEINAYKELVLDACQRWQPLAVIEKTGGYGVPIIDYLLENQYGRQWRNVRYDSFNKEYRGETYGIETQAQSGGRGTRWIMLYRLYEFLKKGWLDPGDPRLRSQVNTFVYTDSGRPEAEVGCFDDIVFAYGLALMGLDQIALVEEAAKEEVPRSIPEILAWERAHGMKWRDHQNKDLPSNPLDWYEEAVEEVLFGGPEAT